jgi:LSD1 subclass zinc finger protein
MLLTCPTCRSGLEVPEGTTAQVRCPTCRTIFAPADGIAPAPPPPPRPAPARPARPRDEDDDEDRPRRRRRREDEDDDEDRPRRKKRAEAAEKPSPDEPDEKAEEIRKADERRRRRREREEESKLSPEERRTQRAQFTRGMWGCKLLHISFALYAVSLFIMLTFFVVAIVAIPVLGLILVAGLLGLLNWVLAAVGVGLCISSRPSPGHYGYGIAAAIGVIGHAILLVAVVNRMSAMSITVEGESIQTHYLAWWSLPTQLHILTFYLAQFLYPDENLIAQGAFTLGLVAGVFELVRLMLVMMLVSCVARAAGDEELSYRCTRAAGIGAFGPGGLAAVVLVIVATLLETGGFDTTLGKILMVVTVLGIYAILAGMLVPSVVACQEAADACEFPYEATSNMVP